MVPKRKITIVKNFALSASKMEVFFSMATGVVKWFNENKGYGFIRQEDGTEVFVHYSAIQGDGFRTLSEGSEVEFEVTSTEKGLQATNVVPK